jgi:hypothetical protein
MMPFYGTDFALVTMPDGSLDFDISRTVTGPIVVLQRVILKILALPGEIWWEPQIGTNLRKMRGSIHSKTDIDHLHAVMTENAMSDPQVDEAKIRINFDSKSKNLSVAVWIKVGQTNFQQSITFDGQNALSGGGVL